MKIIGLSGKARSGKDTVGGFILDWCDANGRSSKKDSFATLLKVSAARALGCPMEWTAAQCVEFCDELKHPDVKIAVVKQWNDPRVRDGDTYGPPCSEMFLAITGREFLQNYGTEAHRETFSKEFWVDALFKQYVGCTSLSAMLAPDVLALTDARFPNEAAAVNERGGAVIEVIRPDNPDALSGGLEQKHKSEAGLPTALVTYRIINDGTLDDLHAKVYEACNSLLG